MLLLALPLVFAAAPAPGVVWDAEVEPIGELPEYVRQLQELAAPDPARLASNPLQIGPLMRPSLGSEAGAAGLQGGRLASAALLDVLRIWVAEGGDVHAGGRFRIGGAHELLVFERTKLHVRLGMLEYPRAVLPGLQVQPGNRIAVDAARLALAVAAPEGAVDPILHAVEHWPEAEMDARSIEVLLDALVARAAQAHLEYLRVPNDKNAIQARQEYEMVLDVLAWAEASRA